MKKFNKGFSLMPILLLIGLVGLIAVILIRGTNNNITKKSQLVAAIATNLSLSDNFAVLAGAGITNTGATTVIGDVGTHPTLTETGFGPGADAVTITGTNHIGDAVTQGAKTDLITAYNSAAGNLQLHITIR